MHTHMALPAELTIYTAAQTRAAWLDAIAPAADGPLCLHAADVADIDSAGLQLLLSLQRSMAAQQRALRLLHASQVLRDACARAGLGDILLPESQT